MKLIELGIDFFSLKCVNFSEIIQLSIKHFFLPINFEEIFIKKKKKNFEEIFFVPKKKEKKKIDEIL